MSWRPAPIGPDHANRVGAWTARLSRERQREITQLHRSLFGEPLTAVLIRGDSPGITVNSVLDRHARLTIPATMSDDGWPLHLRGAEYCVAAFAPQHADVGELGVA